MIKTFSKQKDRYESYVQNGTNVYRRFQQSAGVCSSIHEKVFMEKIELLLHITHPNEVYFIFRANIFLCCQHLHTVLRYTI